MSNPTQTPMSREAFFRWLNEGGALLSCDCAALLKVSKTEQVSYLFLANSYQKDVTIHWDSCFGFCGMYAHNNGSLRLADITLRKLVDGLTTEEYLGEEQLMLSFSRQVTQCIGETISWDRKSLEVRELSRQQQDKLDTYRTYSAAGEAARLFFAGKEPEICIHYAYDTCPHTHHRAEDTLLAYVQDPTTAVKTEAERYIENNQEELLAAFLETDVLQDAYNALVQDTDSPLHRMRDITAAIEASKAKTVSVTVEKEGKELTFKTTAASLKGCRQFYSTYDIAAPDRRAFERLFGKYAEYTVEDITKITYGRAVLYEAPEVQTQGMSLQMRGM